MMRFVVLGENMLSLLRFSGKIVGQNRVVLGEIFSEIPFDEYFWR